MLYDIVLGGVLSATFIPVFVDQLANRAEERRLPLHLGHPHRRRWWCWWPPPCARAGAGPVLHHRPDRARYVGARPPDRPGAWPSAPWPPRLLRWFVIQIAAYGFFALAAALLNTRRRFVAVAWAPIVNNVVCIGVLVWFGCGPARQRDAGQRRAPPGPARPARPRHLARRGAPGASPSSPACGVADLGLTPLALGPPRRRAAHGDPAQRLDLRVRGGQPDRAVRRHPAGRHGRRGTDPVSSYTYAYAFLQMPYGIVAVTVMSVVAPDLAERWSTGQTAGLPGPAGRRAGGPCWPSSSRPPSACCCWPSRRWPCCSATGHSTAAETATTGAALAMFALGLPGFCSYLYIVRVLQSMQRTKVAFYLYLVENAINIALAVAAGAPAGRARPGPVALDGLHGGRARSALALLRRWFGRLGTPATWAPLRRVALATRGHGRRRSWWCPTSRVPRTVWPSWSGWWLGGGGWRRLRRGGIVLGRREAAAARPGAGQRPHGLRAGAREALDRGPDGSARLHGCTVADSPHARRADRDRQRL